MCLAWRLGSKKGLALQWPLHWVCDEPYGGQAGAGPPPPACPPPAPHVAVRAKEALSAARHRKGVRQLPEPPRQKDQSKTKLEEGQTGKEVSQKIAEVMAAARQRVEQLSPRQELKRRAEQALKAAKYRGASPESRKRYEVEQALELRATKAISEAVARKCTAADVSGTEPEAPWETHEESMQWEEHPTDYFAWMEAGNMLPSSSHAEAQSSEDFGYDLWQDGSLDWDTHWPLRGDDALALMQDRSNGMTSLSQWAPKRFLPTRAEETDVLRAWPEPTTAASSTRSVASAADSNSETGPAHEDEEADELLASCWKAVTEAAEV
ncbi:unnamed protein product [Effrenium voratum]|uniref:Uncharacterized protein n=1 Tax=Effrenium voratum TaxID=2562239 RepID=A0AA36JK28_9DINO|nr:unnamed protein product [Effrenium voratum]